MRFQPTRALCAILFVVAIGFTAAARAQETEGKAEEHEGSGWASTIAKTLNFAVLAGGLGYVLRKPVAAYLSDRGTSIRKDLTSAAELRAESERNLAQVREQLARLPGEIEGLRRRGADELAQEKVRLAEATVRERDRVVERTRREIDLQFRIARRTLLEHVTDVAMRIARTRIEREISPEDQARLIDRYSSEVRP